MPSVVALMLLQLGCAPATFTGPSGPFLVWVCPPVVEEPATPAPAQDPDA